MIKDSTLFVDVLAQSGEHLFSVFKLTKERNEYSICLYRIKHRKYFKQKQLSFAANYDFNLQTDVQ